MRRMIKILPKDAWEAAGENAAQKIVNQKDSKNASELAEP